MRITTTPLSLYVHTPWCKRKCPYCDFNSHEPRGDIPHAAYLQALSDDLRRDWQRPEIADRGVRTVFIGGGTPSMLDAELLADWLNEMASIVSLTEDAEITLEANPESVRLENLKRLRRAGVNRLSLGAQSFSNDLLRRIGRIHDSQAIVDAFATARAAGFENINLDLMFGLPEQSVAQSRSDLERAGALAPEHLSFYQLTLEPNTLFHARPPRLPDENAVADMENAGIEWLEAHGWKRYEISAYARAGKQCAHNLNYWQFGDYLGIGAGAHGKLSFVDEAACARFSKHRDPARYMSAGEAAREQAQDDASPFVAERRIVSGELLAFEFMLNASRLTDGFSATLFERTTGMPFAALEKSLKKLERRGLVATRQGAGGTQVRPTRNGLLFLNDIQSEFLPSNSPSPADLPDALSDALGDAAFDTIAPL